MVLAPATAVDICASLERCLGATAGHSYSHDISSGNVYIVHTLERNSNEQRHYCARTSEYYSNSLRRTYREYNHTISYTYSGKVTVNKVWKVLSCRASSIRAVAIAKSPETPHPDREFLPRLASLAHDAHTHAPRLPVDALFYPTAVLAGRTISDLQLPVMPTGSQGLPEQPQLQRKGSAGSVGSAGGGAPNGRSRPRLAANGEKVAGPARPPPTANGEKVAGYAGGGGEGGRASPPTVPGALAKRLDVTVGRVKGDGKEQEAWKKSEEALKKKEQSVRNALKEKQRSLRQETQLLAHVDRELAQLALDHQMEVNDLRKS